MLVPVAALLLGAQSVEAPGGKVAFTRGEALWIANADGSELVQLAEYGLRPAWSPDGSDLAYLLKLNRQKSLAEIAVMTVATKEVRPIVFRPTIKNEAGMRFVEELRLLDRNRIALIGSINPMNCQYVVVNINTGKETSWSLGLCGSFVTSPDRQHVTYPCAPGMSAPDEDLRQCINFENDRRAYTPPQPKGRVLTDPVWSADSTQIAVLEHNLQTQAKGVVVVPLKGEAIRVPLSSSFDAPLELQWAGNTLALKAGADRYTVDPVTKILRMADVDVEGQISKQAERKRAVAAIRNRGIESAAKLGAKDYDIDVFVPAGD
jgi:hypothetical protein